MQLSTVTSSTRSSSAQTTCGLRSQNQAASMRGWLQEAEALVSRLEQHTQWRDTLRGHGTKVNEGWVFAEREMQWEHNALSDMVDHMERLKTVGMSDMTRRLEMAETITERSITGHESHGLRYTGHQGFDTMEAFTLTPQLGLVLLGADPESGLGSLGTSNRGAPGHEALRGPTHQ